MTLFYSDDHSEVHHGDCCVVMASMQENHFDTVICDPPYHLTQASRSGSPRQNDPETPFGRTKLGSAGFMGKTWDGGDIAFQPETWRAVLRVCKPGAMLLAFGGTRTFHRLVCAIEDGGWETRDCLAWLHGSGFPKSLDLSKALDAAVGAEREVVGPNRFDGLNGKQNLNCYGTASRPPETIATTAEAKLWSGWGTALKPAMELICLAMKPLDGTFAQNAMKHGVAGLNVDGGRIAHDEPAKTTTGRKFTSGQLSRRSNDGRDMERLGAIAFGRGIRELPASANVAGRWPANVILDEDAAEMLDEQSGKSSETQRILNRGGGRAMDGWGLDSESKGITYGDSGGASRFFYTAKASRSDRGASNDHPTVKPTELMKYLCKLTATPTGGKILDPFSGSGSTIVAARECGRHCTGIELEEDHCRIIVDRIRQMMLFPV